jgi:hypothetical protein
MPELKKTTPPARKVIEAKVSSVVVMDGSAGALMLPAKQKRDEMLVCGVLGMPRHACPPPPTGASPLGPEERAKTVQDNNMCPFCLRHRQKKIGSQCTQCPVCLETCQVIAQADSQWSSPSDSSLLHGYRRGRQRVRNCNSMHWDICHSGRVEDT